MAHKSRMKGVKKVRGSVRHGISKKRTNSSHKVKQVPMEVLLGEKPMPKSIA